MSCTFEIIPVTDRDEPAEYRCAESRCEDLADCDNCCADCECDCENDDEDIE